MKREIRSYCRICGTLCGTRVALDHDGRIASVRGDKDNKLSRGFACMKGVQGPDLYYTPDRLSHPLKRMPDGRFQRISLDLAFNEIAERLGKLLSRDGSQSHAIFRGTYNNLDSASFHMIPAWMGAVGSQSIYSTVTIDQSAKIVAMERIGSWAGGKQEFHNADVWMLVGTNPLVSNWGGFNSVAQNPVLMLKEAKMRGLKLIVIDPRRTETAEQADIFIQPRPGEDIAVAAGLLHIILSEGWYDAEFCDAHVEGIARLRESVAAFTPLEVAQRADVPAELLHAAAKAFAHTATRGQVVTGTGPNMAARSNLIEHLYECLNVICGRYLRVGEEARAQILARGRVPLHAQVNPPKRSWETGQQSRIRDTGMIGGEMPTGVLADEILLPGEGQISSLIVQGGNPVQTIPDRQKVIRALKNLDLLVVIDPFMSETASMADYVIPTTLAYEKPDIALAYPYTFPIPFAQFTPQVAAVPDTWEVVDDWYPYWALAHRLGFSLNYDGVPLDMRSVPQTEQLLRILARQSPVPFDEIKALPGGAIFHLPPQIVQPSINGASAKLEVAPDDVVEELKQIFKKPAVTARLYPFRLISRRIRETMNSTYRTLPSTQKRMPTNPLYMHPTDLSQLDLTDGAIVNITSDHGQIAAVVATDNTLRSGTVAMTHGWGTPDGNDPVTHGASTSDLVSSDRVVETINAMPRMSAIPVSIAPQTRDSCC